MTRIALVCLDIDGTLVGSTGEIDERVWAAAAAARDSGIRIAICSGRPALGVALQYAKRLDAGGWHSFQNGASIVHLDTGASHSVSLPPAVVPELIDRARRHGRILELYSDTDYTVESTAPRAVAHAALLGVPFVPRPLDSYTGPVVRAQWVVAHDEADAVLAESHFGLEVSHSSSPVMPDTSFVGVTPSGVNKAVAVRAIAAEYRVSLEAVMFVGDGGNDLAAMRVVGFAVATANAEPDVRDVARLVVSHVDDGGAAQALHIAASGRRYAASR
ncbi:MAG TPA: HAD-IIB family hydrolase [Gemmatimonas sp.]|nr:HAD-IIB family hydrolase [Gemmatimonas sp.]